ncbi:MAG: PP2C family protein-serine/threonine phosphatase [Hormoscilla sp.]
MNNEQAKAPKGNILVVDDEPANLRLLMGMLSKQGYKVRPVPNGKLALSGARTIAPDLILLDIMMPEMNGYEVCEQLKADERTRDVPVIFISALDEILDKVKAFEVGGVDYITKPFHLEEVLARVKNQLRLRQMQAEITRLNEQLQAENLRMSAELEVTRRLQEIILPRDSELNKIKDLEIAGFMEPADEVGGDYYDVLQQDDGRVKIGIGDVTGHGLESGILMLMVQTAVRTLLESNETDPVRFLDALNRTIYKNVERMNSDKNLTLVLLDYQDGVLTLSGQHEEIIVVRSGGRVELIDTLDLGFPIGLEDDIVYLLAKTEVKLNPGDGVVLYTDGITEAENQQKKQYGLERLTKVVSLNWQLSAAEMRQAIITDLRQHIGQQKVYDDITLVVLKQKLSSR